MNDRTLGPSYQTFGPNFRITLALLSFGGLFCWLAYGVAVESHQRIAWAIFYLLSVGFGLLAVIHLSVRVWVHEGGIRYRGLFGHAAIPWRQISRIYFGSYDIHFHFVALGTFYRLKLMTKSGTTLSVGERLHRANDLAELIQRHTIGEMVRKAAQEFANGVELDFGAIRMSRKRGMIYRKWFAQRELKLEDIVSYDVTESHVKFRKRESRFSSRIRAEKVANVHVLKALLWATKQVLQNR